MNVATKIEAGGQAQRMADVLARQKAAHIREGAPTAEARIERIDRAVAALLKHNRALVDALTQDFGARAEAVSGITDIGASLGPMKHAKAHLKTWMKPERRKTTPAILGLLGAKGTLRN
jgi:coniferyl-aldehyde dehydrogenase